MFFDLQLLRYQSDGVFWMAWVAAIYGTKSPQTSALLRLEDKHVKSAKVARMCDSLQNYLLSGSSQVNERMSLRLSAVLMEGIIRIHNRKVDLFQFHVNRIFDKIQRPSIAEFLELRKPALKDKKKRQHKKKPVLEPSPEIEGDIQPVVIPDDNAVIEGGLVALKDIPIASIDQITMPEDVRRRAPDELENLGFGDEQNEIAQLIMASTDFRQPDAFEKAIGDIEAAIHAPSSIEPPETTPKTDDTKKRPRTSDESQASKRQKHDHVEAPSEMVAIVQEQPQDQVEIPPPLPVGMAVTPKRGRKKFSNFDVIEKKLATKRKAQINESIYGSNINKFDESINVDKNLELAEYLSDDVLDVFKIRPSQKDVEAIDSK